jgi:predicted RNase H-related nuclease YkuK (DUF458 family)
MVLINIEDLEKYLSTQGPDTKIYMGADSERINIDGKWMTDYLLSVIVHEDSKHGAKIFGEIHREPDYDKNLSRPRMRLMNEVSKICELYLKIEHLIEKFPVEIHLDVNPLPQYGSSCVASESVGYVKGMTGIDAKIKKESWAATNAADSLKRLLNDKNRNENVHN